MKIAILGSGGREHAIVHSISKSKKIKKIYCLPGNAGTSDFAKNVSIDIIPDCGHMIMVEQPEAVFQSLQKFILFEGCK